MYPITAGGGQGSAYQSPAIRQGNFVFGFFLDDVDQQVPVIMGILGANAKTEKQNPLEKIEEVLSPPKWICRHWR